uniref:Uncharacterized protein MANES_06G152800 n=1 Tax=Rhizophora mucronata TaxID=61149 RepID=A0A2P2QMR1_RHIMU
MMKTMSPRRKQRETLRMLMRRKKQNPRRRKLRKFPMNGNSSTSRSQSGCASLRRLPRRSMPLSIRA